VLLLRGPQTPGELRSRTDRMYRFEALDDVVSTLDRLALRNPPLVCVLPRQLGTKESRYMHLFSGEPQHDHVSNRDSSAMGPPTDSGGDRIARLEQDVARLREELADVQQQLAAFRKQFE